LLALGATIIGPRNVELERQNPNLLRSLYTYAGIIPNMKLSFADARNLCRPNTRLSG
jgi:oxalate decarboxylase